MSAAAPPLRAWDRVRVGSGKVVSRILGIASSGRVLIVSETSGRSRMVEASALRLVERYMPPSHESNDREQER